LLAPPKTAITIGLVRAALILVVALGALVGWWVVHRPSWKEMRRLLKSPVRDLVVPVQPEVSNAPVKNAATGDNPFEPPGQN
jgi:hypothetical protein